MPACEGVAASGLLHSEMHAGERLLRYAQRLTLRFNQWANVYHRRVERQGELHGRDV
jgi:hypothetical protein